MPDLTVRARHLVSSERDLEAVSKTPGENLAVDTPVSTVFGLIGITGVLLCPWMTSRQLSWKPVTVKT